MVDVDRRLNIGHSQAHVAALKRLCARANKSPHGPRPLRRGLLSFTPLAAKAIKRLKSFNILVQEGLHDEEFARVEAEFGFSFPPDLRAVLAEGLPVGAGFPDWRSGGSQQLKMRLNLPLAGLSYQVGRGKFWCKQWGQRPSDMEAAVKIARQALRKVPVLIPLYSRFYIPSSPELAGNPVLFVHENEVSCYAYDLGDFFERGTFGPCDPGARRVNVVPALRRQKSLNLGGDLEELYCKERCDRLSRELNVEKSSNGEWNSEWCRRSLDGRYRRKSCHSFLASDGRKLVVADVAGAKAANFACLPKTPRWIEFWSEVVEKRQSLCMGSPERLFSSSMVDGDVAKRVEEEEFHRSSMPTWMEGYLEGLAAVLRNGGWREEDINDIIQVHSSSSSSSSSSFADMNVHLDSKAVLEGMLLKADSLCEFLRRAGWSSQDVSEIFNFDFSMREPPRRPAKKLSPEFVERIGKLAEYVAQA